MSAKLILIFFFYFKKTNSQYFGLPSPNPYQFYNYYTSGSTPSLPQPMYTPTTSAYPPTYQLPTPFSPTFTPTSPSVQPTFAPTLPPMPTYLPPAYSPPPTYAPTVSPTYAPVLPPVPKKSPKVAAKSTPNFAPIGSAAPKCSPATATAYYITAVQEAPKAVVMKEKAKESLSEQQLPPPAYNCPFCTGFANVPKNKKLAPPPPCSSVLPGILDKIPTIALPDELKLKSLSKLAPPPTLLSDLLEHKLSGKLRFDEDLLDGFLTGLGLGKSCR